MKCIRFIGTKEYSSTQDTEPDSKIQRSVFKDTNRECIALGNTIEKQNGSKKELSAKYSVQCRTLGPVAQLSAHKNVL